MKRLWCWLIGHRWGVYGAAHKPVECCDRCGLSRAFRWVGSERSRGPLGID